jgi:hypothetical protein
MQAFFGLFLLVVAFILFLLPVGIVIYLIGLKGLLIGLGLFVLTGMVWGLAVAIGLGGIGAIVES